MRCLRSLPGAGFSGAADVGHQAVVGDEPDASLSPSLAETRRVDFAFLDQTVDVSATQPGIRASGARLRDPYPLGTGSLTVVGVAVIGRNAGGMIGMIHEEDTVGHPPHKLNNVGFG